jgi:hypothetical protein
MALFTSPFTFALPRSPPQFKNIAQDVKHHNILPLPLPQVQPHKAFQPLYFIPPQVMLTIFGTDLEGIVTARAFISSLFSNLRNEFTGDRLFLQFYYPNSDSLVYLSISLIFVYGQWKFHQGSQGIEKFQKIKSFNKKEKFLKNAMFIILFVFTKDVLSAT